MKKWWIRLILVIVGLPVTLILIGAVAFQAANHTNGRLISSGEERAYLIYVPESYDSDAATPLVISIHGYAEWPAHQRDVSHWNDLADQYGFIVVYPSGTDFPLHWRTSGAPGSDSDPMLEVRFISDLMDELEQTYNIDPNRIYANGLSNGGGMSFILSCKLSERIAAVGLVSGAYLTPWDECNPSRRVPAIAFHGTADPIVPFQGGPSRSFNLPFPAIPDWINAFASHNQCASTSVDLLTSGEVSGIQFDDCAADVVFYTIIGGGHAWPGGEPIPEQIVGYTTQAIDATQLMWDFFQSHPMSEP